MSTFDLFKQATEIDGISGHEQNVSRWFVSQIKDYVDEIKYDRLGSVAAIKKSKNPNAKVLMLDGHLDEVGFIVKYIHKNGCLGIKEIGGWFSQNLLSSRVTLTTNNNQTYQGCITSIAPHILSAEARNKVVAVDNMLVDCGFRSDIEALAAGVEIGNMIVVNGECRLLSDTRLLAKAIDNRYSLVMMIELARALKDLELEYDLVFNASVQEEVGLRGALTASYMISPDLAIVLDCSPSACPYDNNALGQIGAGALIRVLDGGFIPNQAFIDYYIEMLEATNSKYQYFISAGNTNASVIHKHGSGVVTLTACICGRSLHTCSSVIDLDDYSAVFNGLKLMLCKLNDSKIDELLNSMR